MSEAEGAADSFRSRCSTPTMRNGEPGPSDTCCDDTLRFVAHRLTKLIGSHEELEALLQSDIEQGIEDPIHLARYNDMGVSRMWGDNGASDMIADRLLARGLMDGVGLALG